MVMSHAEPPERQMICEELILAPEVEASPDLLAGKALQHAVKAAPATRARKEQTPCSWRLFQFSAE
jgi:hypothetical protein